MTTSESTTCELEIHRNVPAEPVRVWQALVLASDTAASAKAMGRWRRSGGTSGRGSAVSRIWGAAQWSARGSRVELRELSPGRSGSTRVREISDGPA